MKTSPSRICVLSAAIFCSLFPTLHAQTTATTDPVGFVTVSASNKPTSAGGYNFLSLPLNRHSVFQTVVPVGGVSTVGNVTVISLAGTPFTPNQFNGAGNAHYLEITNGTYAGETSDITATSASTITLADNITAAITAGTTTFRIRPHWTLANAFGTPDGSAAAILGGTSASVADVLTIIDPAAALPADQSRYYYFCTTSTPNPRWQRASNETDASAGDDTDATNSIIRSDTGIQFLRRNAGTAASLVILGEVKTGTTAIPIEGGASDTTNLISNPYPMASTRLDQTGLYTGNAATGLVGGNATTADVVRILDPQIGIFTDFYYDTTVNQWKTGFTDASLYTIPTGASAAIIRKAGRSSFTWYAPQPAMNLSGAVPALQLLSAVSRKTHPGAGVGGSNFNADVNLPLAGTTGIESRSGSSATIVFTFSNNISNPGTPSAGNATFSGSQVAVTLTGLTPPQSLTLSLNNVMDSYGQTLSGNAVSLRLLPGDVNGSGGVTVGDLQAVKNNLSQQITMGNFRADTNASSSVTVSDLQTVKNNLGQSLP